MLRRLFYFTIFTLLSHNYGFAQPLPCGPVPAMTSTCSQACIICDIDGFTGINNSTIQGQAPPGFCTSFAHHMQWIAFIAGTTNLTIELRVFGCQQNNGLEVGIYEGVNCENFQLVTECDTDIEENSTRIFKNTKPLTIGQYYFWVMDGSNGDICSYTIKVLEGSTKVAPLEKAAEIIIPNVVCQNEEVSIKTNGLIGATIYDWSIDGKAITSGLEMKNTFSEPGEYTICLNARNVCDKAPEACRKIKVERIPTTKISQEICFGDCYEFNGKNYCETKIYPIILKGSKGCDSIIELDLRIKEQIVTSQEARICEGDTLRLGDGVFTAAGEHIAYILNADGCKIKVNLTLTAIKCNIKSSEIIEDVSCNNFLNGKIKYKITNGTGPFTYKWQQIENNSVNGEGKILKENETIEISPLDEGNYIIEVFDNFGNTSVAYAHVKQPSVLKSSFEQSNWNGFSVPCFDDAKAFIKTSIEGGNGSYKYLWSSGQTTQNLEKIKAGTYNLTVIDAKGCTLVTNVILTEPGPLIMNAKKYNPDCNGPFTGYLEPIPPAGGVAPFLYSFNDGPFLSNNKFEGLGSSINKIIIKDANDCTAQTIDTLVAAKIPIFSIDSTNSIELGDSILLEVFSSFSDQLVSWSPNLQVNCKDCFTTKVRPVNTTTYTVELTSKDGCKRSATIAVEVVKNYSFVISNVISPNDDGINDRLRYNAGKDVGTVLFYEVYDRWGSKVYQTKNSPAGLIDLEWQGELNGKNLSEGNYVWLASVKYIDDVVVNYKGTLAIVR